MEETKIHFKFEEGEGTVTRDSRANIDGTLQSGVSWVNGKIGSGVNFTGGDSSYITLPVQSLISKNNDFSIAFWFKSNTTGEYSSIFSHGLDVDTDLVNVIVNPNSAVCVGHYDGTNTRYVCSSADSVTTGQWHHLVFTWEADGTGGGTPSLYLDNVLYQDTSLNFVSPGVDNQAYIGCGGVSSA